MALSELESFFKKTWEPWGQNPGARQQSLSSSVSLLRRSCAVKEAEVAKAKDDERPLGIPHPKMTLTCGKYLNILKTCQNYTWKNTNNWCTVKLMSVYDLFVCLSCSISISRVRSNTADQPHTKLLARSEESRHEVHSAGSCHSWPKWPFTFAIKPSKSMFINR